MKKYPVITISREYASYGRKVAKGLAERLGIPYYDREFITEVAQKSGYSVEEIEKEGEEMSRGTKIRNAIFKNPSLYTNSYNKIFKAQKEVVLDVAKEPCIIVGRCADYILDEAGIDSFHVFIHADMEHRIPYAKTLVEDEDDDIEKFIERNDHMRSIYYKQYTGRDIGCYKNYDIMLDTGKLGVEKCIDILYDAIIKG